jgi:hypothetical protein
MFIFYSHQNLKVTTSVKPITSLHQFNYFASKHKRNQTYQIWMHENHPIELHCEMFEHR